MRISFVGAGSVALSLAATFRKARHTISQVYAPTLEHALRLADGAGTSAVTSIDELCADVDFVIIATPDSAIESVAAALPPTSATVLHVSGSTEIDVLKPYFKNYGVLYPLQTFSSACIIDEFSEIPVFVEAESDVNLQRIGRFATTISREVWPMNSLQRKALHAAAVFSCNFVNLLLSEAFDVCSEHAIEPRFLETLVNETVRKAFASGNPSEVQTGPAKRGDMLTIEKHLTILPAEKREVYTALTKQIMAKFKSEN